jgi:hypothetical protein
MSDKTKDLLEEEAKKRRTFEYKYNGHIEIKEDISEADIQKLRDSYEEAMKDGTIIGQTSITKYRLCDKWCVYRIDDGYVLDIKFPDLEKAEGHARYVTEVTGKEFKARPLICLVK